MTFEQYEEILTILETWEHFELSQALERTVGYDRERRLKRREKQLKRIIAKQRTRLERDRWHLWPEEMCGSYDCFIAVKDGRERWTSNAYFDHMHRIWRYADDIEGRAVTGTVTHWRELPPGPEDV